VRVAPCRGAFAAPGHGDPLLVADLEGERHADGDRKHRRKVADHRVQPEPCIAHVDVAVTAARRAVLAPHVLREDAPRLDAARDVDAHVALERRADVVRPHCGGNAHGGSLVPAPGVEGSGDLPLLVEDVPALLDRTGDQHVAVHPQQVLAVEARFLHLFQRLDRLGLANCHVGTLPFLGDDQL
jgi:hypothetical protein